MRDLELWDRISDYSFDEEGVALPFSARLARDMCWSESFTAGAIQEYRCFAYLCCISETPLTPSEEVDEVWHLHLVYTRAYWEDFCPNVLGKTLHHGPTKGGGDERTKFRSAYENTLWLYEQEFEIGPPHIYWPQGNARFSKSNLNRRINSSKYFIVPRYAIYGTLLACVLGYLLITFVDRDRLVVMASVAGFLGIIGIINREIKNDRWPQRNGNSGGCGGCGACGGGCGGCGG